MVSGFFLPCIRRGSPDRTPISNLARREKVRKGQFVLETYAPYKEQLMEQLWLGDHPFLCRDFGQFSGAKC